MRSSLIEAVSVPCHPESPSELSSTLALRISKVREHHTRCSSAPGLVSRHPIIWGNAMVKSLGSEEYMQIPELRQRHKRSFPPTALRWTGFPANPGVGGCGAGCRGTTWQICLNMSPASKVTSRPVQPAPFKAVYGFPSHWRFGFDLQGTEMNVNLFKKNNHLAGICRVQEPLATVFCSFWWQARRFRIWKIPLKKKMPWRNVKLTSESYQVDVWLIGKSISLSQTGGTSLDRTSWGLHMDIWGVPKCAVQINVGRHSDSFLFCLTQRKLLF